MQYGSLRCHIKMFLLTICLRCPKSRKIPGKDTQVVRTHENIKRIFHLADTFPQTKGCINLWYSLLFTTVLHLVKLATIH